MKNDKAQDTKKVAAGAPGEAEASAIAEAVAVPVPAVASIRRKAPPAKLNMLRALVALLSILWILGLVTSYTMGGMINILLALAMAVFITDRLVPPKSA
jgi:uncharacterized protein DUF5670